MSLIKKQIEFESDYSITIVSTIRGEHYAVIFDESGDEVWTQPNMSEGRDDALANAEGELNDMFQLWLDEQEEKDDLPPTSDERGRDYGVPYDRT